MKRTVGTAFLVSLFLIMLSACGGGIVEPPPPVVLMISPETANVVVTQSLQFTAEVFNSTNKAVTWSLSGAGCTGAACGTLSDSGLYTAPADVPNPPTVTVKAALNADASKWATVEVTIILDVDLWEWISGSDAANQGGIYGTRGVPAPTNVPGSRTEAVSWMDLQGRLWLFGGGSLNDLWQYDPETQEWTWESGSDSVYQGGQYGTRGQASPANFPGAREGAVSWVDPQGLLWLFGGTGLGQKTEYSGTLGSLNDVWSFDPATLEWTWITGSDTVIHSGIYGTKGVADPSNAIGSRFAAVCWLDLQGKVWVFGGRGRDSRGVGDHVLNDLWRFDPTTLEWTWMSGADVDSQPGQYGTQGQGDPANVPGARYGAVSWADSQGRLWLFGGIGMDSASHTGQLNDLWRYDPETSVWTWMAGSDTKNQAGVYGLRGTASPSNYPGARGEAVSWLDPEGRFWLFGGASQDIVGFGTKLNDLWVLDPSTMLWTWVAGSDAANQLGIYGTQGVVNWLNAPGGRAWAIPWVDAGGSLWLFGGGGRDSMATEGGLNDLWKFVR